MAVPVLLITGPTGVGKSTVLAACSELPAEAGVPHAAVSLHDIGGLRPAPADDEWNGRIVHRNLARFWSKETVPGVEVTVALLRAPLPGAARADRGAQRGVFATAGVEDFAVNNVDRPAADVAAEVLRRAGWLG